MFLNESGGTQLITLFGFFICQTVKAYQNQVGLVQGDEPSVRR